jgi:hypothetical protein
LPGFCPVFSKEETGLFSFGAPTEVGLPETPRRIAEFQSTILMASSSCTASAWN